ncbi:MAG: methyltransferase domain-containing protein [Holosporaceae bacterium]|nr:MAG: methyltransferase domain-containing protein [Holosporaceae bacterium]
MDVGCGGGLLTEPLFRMGAAVHGIDPSEKEH